jgi:hypothetical protein
MCSCCHTVHLRVVQYSWLTLGLNWPGREADRLPSSVSAVKNAWSYTSAPTIFLHGVVLNHRDNFRASFVSAEYTAAQMGKELVCRMLI